MDKKISQLPVASKYLGKDKLVLERPDGTDFQMISIELENLYAGALGAEKSFFVNRNDNVVFPGSRYSAFARPSTGGSDNAEFFFMTPPDFNNILVCDMFWFSEASSSFATARSAKFGTEDEQYNQHSNGNMVFGYTTTIGQLDAFDFLPVLGGLEALDVVTLDFNPQMIGPASGFNYYLGIGVKYE